MWIRDRYTRRRRALIGAGASDEFRPGCPEGEDQPRLAHQLIHQTASARHAAQGEAPRPTPEGHPGTGEPTFGTGADGATRGDTCHLDVVDAAGNIVSATPVSYTHLTLPTILR